MQALGGGPAAQQSFEPGITEEAIELLQGDLLILCTDGLHDLVPEAGLIVTSSGRTPAEATEAMVQAALEAGGYDNITVILLIVDAQTSPVLSVELEQQLRTKLKRNPPAIPVRLASREPILPPILAGLFFGTLTGLALGWWIHNHL
jgi:serine/threonine protein phosphatase PrpC